MVEALLFFFAKFTRAIMRNRSSPRTVTRSIISRNWVQFPGVYLFLFFLLYQILNKEVS